MVSSLLIQTKKKVLLLLLNKEASFHQFTPVRLQHH